MLTYALILVAGYLIGGLPTGIIFCKLVKGVDPRSIGSGSSGATNVSRVLGKKWAALVLILDALKGYLPVKYLAPMVLAADPRAIAGFQESFYLSGLVMAIGVVVGHVWTPYAGFKGGKGVATGAGAMIALDPMSVLIALFAWIITFAISRTVSVSSIIAAIVLPLAMMVMEDQPNAPTIFAGCLAVFIIYTHRANIARLLKKEEKPIV